jgi:hypothetical protein
MKRCPFCKRKIDKTATICEYCATTLPNWGRVFKIGIAIVVVLFLLYILVTHVRL